MSYKLNINEDVYQKVLHWVKRTHIEVSGFGLVDYDKETKEFTVTEAFLLPQEGGAAHTDIDAVGLGKLQRKVATMPGKLRWWWHSHVNMDVFWSGTDTETIREIGRHGWCVATVFNKREETRSAFCHRTESDFGNGSMLHDDIGTFILTEAKDEDPRIKGWDAEFEENVKVKTYIQPALVGRQGAWDDNDLYGENYGVGDSAYDYTRSGDKQPPTLWYSVDDTEGLSGYGVKEEARVLKMKVTDYVRILNGQNGKLIDDLEMQLVQAEATGLLDISKNIYYKGDAKRGNNNSKA